MLNLVPTAQVGVSNTNTNAASANFPNGYTLTPAPTNAANDTVDGSINVVGLTLSPGSPLPADTVGVAYPAAGPTNVRRWQADPMETEPLLVVVAIAGGGM